jgi:hypothetical protein
MAGTVKTRDGIVNDPFGGTGPHIRMVSTASVHTDPNHPLVKRRNSSETMTYLTLVALMMLVLSPVLVPLVITGFHTIAGFRTA